MIIYFKYKYSQNIFVKLFIHLNSQIKNGFVELRYFKKEHDRDSDS